MSLVSTPAILLRSFAYGETSTILKFYTRDLGVTGVMARGVRGKQSRGQGSIGTFAEGVLSLYVKANRELQTLKEFAPTDGRRQLASDVTRFAAASVLAEVVLRHAGEEGNPRLYHRLAEALDRLGETGRDHAVVDFLAEAWGIVDGLGYRPELAHCVACGRLLADDEMGRFDFSAGGIRCGDCGAEGAGPRIGSGARAQLYALVEGKRPPGFRRARAHVKLLNDFVTYHVSEGRPLQSMAFLFDLLSRTDA
jgi:DNA repair protein RecO